MILKPSRRVLISGAALLTLISQLNAAPRLGSGLPTLPTLPLPAGTRVAQVGDSILANANTSNANGVLSGVNNSGVGELIWAQANDPRFNCDVWADAGNIWG